MVYNAVLVVFIGLVAFGIFKETSIMFFVKRLMSTTVGERIPNSEKFPLKKVVFKLPVG